MTLIVGIRCEEGIVLASDSRTTIGVLGHNTTGQEITTKLDTSVPGVILGISGPVGLRQKITMSLADSWDQLIGQKMTPLGARNKICEKMWSQVEPELKRAAVAAQLLGNQLSSMSAICTSLVALPIKGNPTLIEYDQQCASEEITLDIPFVSIGSGKPWADPFLAFLKESLWENHAPKSVSSGTLAAIWTIDHVINTYPSGDVAGKISVARLIKNGDKWTSEVLPPELIDAHRALYKEGVEKLSDFIGSNQKTGGDLQPKMGPGTR